jgi:hypothetical protein
MIDYHVHQVALAEARQALDAVAGGSHPVEWAAMTATIAAEPGCAMLGAFFDHLLERAQGADAEHAVLREAAHLYREGLDALTTTRTLRAQLEQMVLNPDGASFAQFKAMAEKLQQLTGTLEDLSNRVQNFQARIEPPFQHVVGHALANDQPVSAWLWRDVVLSRRTDAFVRAVLQAGDGSPQTSAFGFGVLARYSANLLGSAYLAHVVGGPRRSHPVRDRLGRYAAGAWIEANEPASMTLRQLRTVLSIGDPPALPEAVRAQAHNSLLTVFPGGAPAVAPDLDLGYQLLLQHLELLDSFPRPPLPDDIDASVLMKIQQSGDASDALYQAQSADGFPGPDPDPQPGGQGNVLKVQGDFTVCLLILAVIFFAGWLADFINEVAEDGDEPAGSAQQKLESFLASDDALKAVAVFFHLDTRLHAAIASGQHRLKEVGLIYPDHLDLQEPIFKQFTVIPPGPTMAGFPHRPMSDPDLTCLQWPSSPIENPAMVPSPYPAGAAPGAFLHGVPGDPMTAVGPVAARHWLDTLRPLDPDDINVNLDSDRGLRQRCWRLAVGSSIDDDPVQVQEMGYGDVT